MTRKAFSPRVNDRLFPWIITDPSLVGASAVELNTAFRFDAGAADADSRGWRSEGERRSTLILNSRLAEIKIRVAAPRESPRSAFLRKSIELSPGHCNSRLANQLIESLYLLSSSPFYRVDDRCRLDSLASNYNFPLVDSTSRPRDTSCTLSASFAGCVEARGTRARIPAALIIQLRNEPCARLGY